MASVVGLNGKSRSPNIAASLFQIVGNFFKSSSAAHSPLELSEFPESNFPLRPDIALELNALSELKLYEGKAKILYDNGDGTLRQYFKDSATAFNNQKKDEIADKGKLNNFISEKLMLEMGKNGIPTHFIKRIDERNQIIRHLTILPLEVIVRNITAGTLCKRYGLEEGLKLEEPIVEYCVKNDELGDPLIPASQVPLLEFATADQVDEMRTYALRINEYLQTLFLACGLILVDFKLEFGVDDENKLYLADEISPDTCRLWDAKTKQKMDKDRFRQDLGGVIEAYYAVAERLGINL